MIAKRLAVFFLIMLLLLSCACGKEKFDPQQAAAHYSEDRAFTAQYIVTTHAGFYGEYQLSCRREGGLSTVTVLQPQSIVGISAVLQDGDIKLQYEDIALDALLPEIAGYAPMDMLHGLLADLRGRVPTHYTLEADCLTLEYRSTQPDGKELLKLIFLHPETLDVLAGECYLEGDLIVALSMESFEWDS